MNVLPKISNADLASDLDDFNLFYINGVYKAKTKLLPVTIRGRKYPVPNTHLGNRIDSTNVVKVAEQEVRFYESFLDEVEACFVK